MQIDSLNNDATYHKERANQLVEDFYTKASGCSVKAQKDNLFEYKNPFQEERSF